MASGVMIVCVVADAFGVLLWELHTGNLESLRAQSCCATDHLHHLLPVLGWNVHVSAKNVGNGLYSGHHMKPESLHIDILAALGIAGSRPWGGLRHAQITAQKMRGEPQDMLQWPAASDEAIKVA